MLTVQEVLHLRVKQPTAGCLPPLPMAADAGTWSNQNCQLEFDQPLSSCHNHVF